MHRAFAGEPTPDDLSDHRQQRGGHTCQGFQHRVQRVEGFRGFIPETLTGTTHIPVGQHIAEGANFITRTGNVRVVQRVLRVGDQVMQLRQNVAIQHICRADIPRRRLNRVQLQEGVSIPHGQQRLTHALADALLCHNEVAATQDWGTHQEPAHGIRAVALKHLVDVRIVAL